MEALKRALAAAANRETFEEFLTILDEDVIWDPGETFPFGKEYGHDGVRSFFRQWIGAFEDFRFEPVEYRDGGNAVFVHMHQWGRGRGSGVTTEIDLWQVWLFSEGKVVRFVQMPSREAALQAAGLSK